LQKTKHGLRYLCVEEWNSLFSVSKNNRDQLIIELLYETGCTVNELIYIERKDIDAKNSSVKIKKKNARNKEARQIFVSGGLLNKIVSFFDDSPASIYLFTSRQSKQITTKRVRQIVGKWCREIGIKDATPQILRYTHIVHAYMKKIPLSAIRQQVGLKRSRAIEIFSQLPVMDIKEAYRNFTKNA